MSARLHRPSAPLADFVDCIWLREGHRAYTKERALPSGTLDIVINLREDALRIYDRVEPERFTMLPGIVICGAHAGYFVVHAAPQASVMGVHFKPGGAFPFLGVPAGDLEGASTGLDSLWGGRAPALRARLLEASCFEERCRILEGFLLENAVRPLRRHAAVARALRAFEEPTLGSVAEVNAQTGLSAKRLLARFRDEVGLGPKAFWRIRRFQAALRGVESRRPLCGADLAARLGYFDQAHLIREFRTFTGLSPLQYIAEGPMRPNHVPLRG